MRRMQLNAANSANAECEGTACIRRSRIRRAPPSSLLVFLGSGDFLVRGGIEQAGHFGEIIGF